MRSLVLKNVRNGIKNITHIFHLNLLRILQGVFNDASEKLNNISGYVIRLNPLLPTR